LRAPAFESLEIFFRPLDGDSGSSGEDLAAFGVDTDVLAFGDRCVAEVQNAADRIDRERGTADDSGLAELTRNDRRVRGPAAARG
jgi:hypothetical protein